MLRPFAILSLILISTFAYSQNSKDYFKVPYEVNEDMPFWQQLMYNEDPDVYKVNDAYIEYYKEHRFSKTTHTQNFKFWNQKVSSLLDEQGKIRPEVGTHARPLSAAESKANNWRNIGPFETYLKGTLTPTSHQANVYCISSSVTNPDVLIAGIEGGALFLTENKGTSWRPLNYDIPCRGINMCKIDPTDENIFYFSCGGDLYKSYNKGESFDIIAEDINGIVLAIDPTDNDILFLATDKGVFRSGDQGENWTQVTPNGNCYDVVLSPNDPNKVYALIADTQAKIDYFYRSTDGGLTFEKKTEGYYAPENPTAAIGGKIGVTQADEDILYVALIGNEKEGDNGWIGLYRSDDGGESWTLPMGQTGGPYNGINADGPWSIASYGSGYHQGFYNFDLGVDPVDPDLLWIGTIRLVESSDGGKNFRSIGGPNSQRNNIHADIQAIEINGSDYWIANDGGIDYSDDALQSSESRKRGISGSNYWGFDSGWNEDVLVGGRYHNGNSAYYSVYGEGESFYAGGAETATGYVDPLYPREVRFSDIRDIELPLTLEDSPQGIDNFQLYPNQNYTIGNSSEVLYDVVYRDWVYIGDDNSFFKSEDNGATFYAMHDFGNATVLELEQSRNDPDVIYAVVRDKDEPNGSSRKLFYSADRGVNWEEIDISFVSNTVNTHIAVSQVDASTIYLAGHGNNENKIFIISDFGENVTNISSPELRDLSINSMISQPTAEGDVLYLGGEGHIYRYRTADSQWILSSDGLPLAFNMPILKPFYKENKLRISTRAFGIWETEFNEPTLTIPQPYVERPDELCIIDTLILDSYSIVDQNEVEWKWDIQPAPLYISSTDERRIKIVLGSAESYDVSLSIMKNGETYTKVIEDMILGDASCTNDMDGDGIPDNIDLDIDGDGLFNTIEDALAASANNDTDNDGVINRLDLDSDGDNISDKDELYDCEGQVPLDNSNMSAGNSVMIASLDTLEDKIIMVYVEIFTNCYGLTSELYATINLENNIFDVLGYRHYNEENYGGQVNGHLTSRVQSTKSNFSRSEFYIEDGNLFFNHVSNACGSLARVNKFCIMNGDCDYDGILDVIDGEDCNFTTDVKDISELVLNVYPNPAFDYIHISTNLEYDSVLFRDSDGRYIQSFNKGDAIDITQWQPGVYTMIIFDKKQVQAMKRVAIIK